MLNQHCSQGAIKLGTIFVEQKLISKEQLETALAEQQNSSQKLGEILVQKQWITSEQLENALQQQHWYRRAFDILVETFKITPRNWNPFVPQQNFSQVPRVGELLVSKGYITLSQLQEALKKQSSSKEKLGEILVAEGFLSDEELTAVLHEQERLRFVISFLIINFGVMSSSLVPVQAGEEKTAQATVHFRAYVPEQVKVEVNPQVFASTDLKRYQGNLLQISSNSESEQKPFDVKYNQETERYTVTAR